MFNFCDRIIFLSFISFLLFCNVVFFSFRQVARSILISCFLAQSRRFFMWLISLLFLSLWEPNVIKERMIVSYRGKESFEQRHKWENFPDRETVLKSAGPGNNRDAFSLHDITFDTIISHVAGAWHKSLELWPSLGDHMT